MNTLLTALIVLALPSPVPTVRYAVKVETGSWEPIAVAEVERMVEARALPAVSAGGTMRLVRSGFADLAEGDYSLVLNGRYVSEAEKFTVYLTFGPGKRKDLPSFHVSDTAALGKRNRGEMQRQIESLADAAGKRLADVVAPRLASALADQAAPPIIGTSLPWTWGTLEVPAPTPGRNASDLLNLALDDGARLRPVRDLGAAALDRPEARDALLRCVLYDPEPDVRIRCIEALEPAARAHVPTQRLLLHAMRHELEPSVLRVLSRVSAAFVGLSRKEALETWLELLAGTSLPDEAADDVAEMVAKEGDVPNLDLAVASCLQQDTLAWQKKHACAQWLLPVIPPARRPAVTARYLQEVVAWETADTLTFDRVIEALTRDAGRKGLDPGVGDRLLDVARRPAAGRARHGALYGMREHSAPTPTLVATVVALMADPQLVTAGRNVIDIVVRRVPDLKPVALGELQRLRASTTWPRPPHRQYGGDEVDQLIKRLER